MEILEAVTKSIRSYYKDNAFSETSKLKEEGMKYTKDYFDMMESEVLGTKEIVEETEEEITDENSFT